MAWTKFNNVTLTSGSREVTVNDGTSVAEILAGFDLVKDGLVYELDTPSAGNLMLVDPWPNATEASATVKVRQTHAPIAAQIHQAIQRLSSNSDTFETLKSAAFKDVATEAEAKNGTADVLPDAAGVLAAINQFGLGNLFRVWDVVNDTASSNPSWIKLATFSVSGSKYRGMLFLSGTGGYSAGNDDNDTGGAVVYLTNSNAADLMARAVVDDKQLKDIQLAVKDIGNNNYELWIKYRTYTGLKAMYFGDIVATPSSEVYSASQPSGSVLKTVDYALNTGNLVGSVSESGGVPTGAVIERGENANGEYIKFADGTVICTRVLAIVSPATWNFPIAMTSAPDTHQAITDAVVPRFVSGANATETSVQYRIWNDAGAASSASCYLLAIGRWY